MWKTEEHTFNKIIQTLGKSKQSLDEDARTIQKWMKSQTHLPEILDLKSIKNFLIINKFSIEITKQKIENYYLMRTKMSDIFKGINPRLPHMKELTEIIYLTVHPQLWNHSRVLFCKIRNENLSEKLELWNVIRFAINVTEIRIKEDIIYSDICIVDCDKMPLSFISKFTPNSLMKALTFYESVFSSRLKRSFVLNLPPAAETVVKLGRTLMKPKLFERICFSTGGDILKDYFPVDYLPEDFGGNYKSLAKLQELTNAEIENHQELFDRLDNLRIDDSLMPERLQNDEDLGFYGSFRKLDID